MEKLEAEIMEKEASLNQWNEETNRLDLNSKESQELFKNIGTMQIQIATAYQRLDELISQIDEIESEHAG